MKRFYVIVLLFLHAGCLSVPFAHDRAARAAQQQDWEKSFALLNDLVRDYPDDPTILYDAGVAAHKQGQFGQAQAYFANAAKSCRPDQNDIKGQAYFNEGNANVELSNFQAAVESYKQALSINPDNERAKHNLEIVLKMLKQQKQQEQQQQQKEDNEKQDQQKKKKSDQQQQNEQEKKDSDNQQDKEQNQQQGSDQDSEQKNDDSQKQQQNQQQEQPQKENDQSEQGRQEEQQKRQQQERERQQQEKQKKEKQGSSEKKKQEKKEQQMAQQDTKGEQEKKQGAASVEQDQQAGKLNMRLAQLLNDREKKDAQLNKQMIRATVKNNMTGQQGENCW